MTALVWDEIGSRTYEKGLDRGVLYLLDGSAIPWNGLVEVVEKTDADGSPVYFDGMKVSDSVTLAAFSGVIKAITYPDKMTELEGSAQISEGMLLGQQKPQIFHLCYRTQVGTDLDEDAGYKIHILYNVTAIPSDKTYSSTTEIPAFSTFEWNISTIAEEVPGYKPTSYICIDSRALDPTLLVEIERVLYGDEDVNPSLIPISGFVNYLYFGYKWKIIDNGDGTWVAITPIEGLIEIDPVDSDLWTLNEVNAIYLSDEVYKISDEMV